MGEHQLSEASAITAAELRSVATSSAVQKLSQLTLPEIEAVVEQIARLVPAGNIPALILSGLVRLSGRRPSPGAARRDINLLLKGVKQTLDTATYSAFFAGPAAVIGGYQKLLKLAGLTTDDAFPQGTWQFYVDYAMREDTARHTNETHGFDTFLNQHQIHLSPVDRITTWVMTAIHCLHRYEALLANEWRERVYTHLLIEITDKQPDAAYYARLYRDWEKERPYGLGSDATAGETYPDYRRRKFDQFLAEATRKLPLELHNTWKKQVDETESKMLPAYQEQMSILAYLTPDQYDEERIKLSRKEAHIGLIHQGRYYLIPVCASETEYPPDVQDVRTKVATMLANSASPPIQSPSLAEIKRTEWPDLRPQLSKPLLQELDMLQQAPILLNCDRQSRHLPLAELRQTERGRGDHALTIFDTGETIIFDQSHIFFDAVWGSALAEIMTQEAINWANHLNTLESPSSPAQQPPRVLTFNFEISNLDSIRRASRIASEVSAETEMVDIQALLKLRHLFKQRNDLVRLTVNDLLLLYRAIHAANYRPDPDLRKALKQLSQVDATQQAAVKALKALEHDSKLNPSIVMPVDASRSAPHLRLYPITFEVPLNQLDFLVLHRRVVTALAAYKNASGDRSAAYTEFDQSQRLYLATLAGFGEVMSKIKEIAASGQSFSVGTLKLMAHIPAPLRQMLERVPDYIDTLNDLIRGRENFSNIGAVVPGSTLIRFMSAKDDNPKKTLIWGVLTDAQGVMRITLRDFRPHVEMLIAAGHKDLATRMANHYLETYARGLNDYVDDLQRITKTSRESRLRKPGKSDA